MSTTCGPESAAPVVGDDAAALLLALQLADSAFPAGLYTLSHGLEGLEQLGEVDRTDPGCERRVAELLHSTLRDVLGPADSVAVACAWAAAAPARAVDASTTDVESALAELRAVDSRLHAAQLCRELREGAVRAGRQVADMAAELVDRPLTRAWAAEVAARRTPGSLSVATGVVSACGGLTRRAAVAADLAALVNGYAGAALRLRLVDHRGAQHLVSGAAPVVVEVADRALRTPPDEIGGFSPLADLASCAHETADTRLFAS